MGTRARDQEDERAPVLGKGTWHQNGTLDPQLPAGTPGQGALALPCTSHLSSWSAPKPWSQVCPFFQAGPSFLHEDLVTLFPPEPSTLLGQAPHGVMLSRGVSSHCPSQWSSKVRWFDQQHQPHLRICQKCILGPHLSPMESETLGVGPGTLF